MKTLPCAHCVVCRKCFVKTIQTAVTDRCLPLRCVVCRTKILKLKQQPHQPHQQQAKSRLHHQTTRHADHTTSQRAPRPPAAAGKVAVGRGPSTAGSGTSRLPRGPMQPLLIYPSEAGGERARLRTNTVPSPRLPSQRGGRRAVAAWEHSSARCDDWLVGGLAGQQQQQQQHGAGDGGGGGGGGRVSTDGGDISTTGATLRLRRS